MGRDKCGKLLVGRGDLGETREVGGATEWMTRAQCWGDPRETSQWEKRALLPSIAQREGRAWGRKAEDGKSPTGCPTWRN